MQRPTTTIHWTFGYNTHCFSNFPRPRDCRMFRSILIVCTANVCRSPMAEGLLRQVSMRDGIAIEIESAGISAKEGLPPAPHAVEAASRRGIDISAHRARQLTPQALHTVDLCLFMEARQRERMAQLMPSVAPKLFRLGHWEGVDIRDPMGQPMEAFENTLSLIDAAVAHWLPHLSR